MFSGSMKVRVEEKTKWPCSVHQTGVGSNSILCFNCKRWIHKWCSGVKGSMCNASLSFICRSYKIDRPIIDGVKTDLRLDIGNGISCSCRMTWSLFCFVVFNDTFSTNRLYRVIGIWNIYCVGPGGTHRNIDKPNKRKIHTNTLFRLGDDMKLRDVIGFG